ncbi:hypothetical protein RIF29_42244 [Crotalaria pallida]|uniref:Transmembrane protein n=1 Tax=Crotalaria pallida TaxID=3830 RepID=A0AAN9E6L0_CROPI
MTRASHVLLLALVLFNIIVLSYGATAEAPKSSSNDASGGEDNDEDYEGVIGTKDEAGAPSPNNVVPGPVGGPVPPGAFDEANTASAPSSDASSLHHFSAFAGAAAATLVAGFFCF